MPSVQDVIEVTELLNVAPIGITLDKCSAVRNRNSSCQNCVDACIEDAIEVSNNEVFIDGNACVDCGACVAVCPPNALHAEDPTMAKVESDMRKHAIPSQRCVIVACARKASKHEADPDQFSEVPCLAHLNELELVRLVASGYDDIILVDGDCSTCKYGGVSTCIADAMNNAIDILESCKANAIITRSSEFPPEIARPHHKNIRGEARRGILFQTGSYVKSVASSVAKKTLKDKFGNGEKSLKDRLSAGYTGRMPSFTPDENYALLDAMEKIAGPETLAESDEILESRHFGDVVVDKAKCSGCGLCVLFCPTEALKHSHLHEPESEDGKYLEFSAEACNQCGLCRDVCLRKCLDVLSKVEVKALFDFEPKLVEISKPKDRQSILSRFKH